MIELRMSERPGPEDRELFEFLTCSGFSEQDAAELSASETGRAWNGDPKAVISRTIENAPIAATTEA